MNYVEPLAICVQARAPVLLWGAPGIGKSAAIAALARALGEPCETVIASIREPSDFAGLPVITHDHDALDRAAGADVPCVALAPPSWALRLRAAGRGLLFLDEINTAPPATQAALLRVVLERTVGDIALGPDVAVVAAANAAEDAAGGWDLAAPLANRFTHLQCSADPSAWIDGTISGWPPPRPKKLPESWRGGVPAMQLVVAGFVRKMPHLLHCLPKEESQRGRAWPSPRSWTMAATLLAASKAAGASLDTEMALVSGAVGDGAALQLIEWQRALDLPDPEDLLRDPSSYSPDDRDDRTFVVLSSVVQAALSKLDVARWRAAWHVLGAAGRGKKSDIGAVPARKLAEVQSHAPGISFADPVVAEQLRPYADMLATYDSTIKSQPQPQKAKA